MAFTFFFRDAQTLESAIDAALPSLRGRAFIHVWDAGCAHGPEPYTLAILLRERMSDLIFRNVRIHATDVDSGFGTQVRSGMFAEAEVQRVPPGILRKYFQPAGLPGCVQVIPELRDRITFSPGDLLSLVPVREGLSLIVCKNVLLHFDEAQRIQVLCMFHRALQPGGMLVMENTQKLPAALVPLFEPLVPHAAVYGKVARSFVEHQAEQSVPHRQGRRRTGINSEGPFHHLKVLFRQRAAR